MSLSQLIEQELNHLAGFNGGHLAVTHAHGSFECDMVRIDPLAVAFQSFVYFTQQLAQAETARLSKIADNLAAKLNYLLEPLRVIEIDSQAGAVQMRSAPPYQQPEQITYYEVLVQRGGTISLVRYQKLPQEPRRPVAAVVTREVFLRLAQDCESAAK
jgi:hypothetical protein